MKKIHMLILGLTFSLLALTSMAIEQGVSAQIAPEGGDLGCADLIGCKNEITCGTRGTANGCNITCEGGGSITCPK
jgi:hypothetical protein